MSRSSIPFQPTPGFQCEPRDGVVSPRRSLAAAVLGFFVITLDALVISVALPAIRDTLGGGISSLQWVVDGYTLPYAAFLMLAGAYADRLGAKWAFGAGLAVFTASSALCALTPSLAWLIAARALQGIGAALMTPASLSLIGEAYTEPSAKARAIGMWSVGGAVAAAAGPLIGGGLTLLSWRLIFLINLPVGLVALWLLAGVSPSRRHNHPIDWPGQAMSLLALIALTLGLIEAGARGLGDPLVLVSLGVATVTALLFFASQARAKNPMVPTGMFRSWPAATTVAIGFTFMVGFFGMVFLTSLYLQDQRGMTPLETGLMFVPVTAFNIVMPVIGARLAERFGSWLPIVLGQFLMVTGLFGLAFSFETASLPILIMWMAAVGLGGGMTMPCAISLLLNTVPSNRAGTASGVLNTSRQVGGTLGIAVFGALLAHAGFSGGMRTGLLIAGSLAVVTMITSLKLRGSNTSELITQQ